MEAIPHRNMVTLVGRVSKVPTMRELPSGDRVTSWGLAVRRPAGHPSNKKSDGIACVAFDCEVSAVVTHWELNDVVSVEGALHHRFRGTSGMGASTYEVEVHRARRVQQAPTSRRTTTGAGAMAESEVAAAAAREVASARRAGSWAPLPVAIEVGAGQGLIAGTGKGLVGGEGTEDQPGARLGAE
ncbi:hypothetical protein Ssi03_56460 [Sphaerisporangium siamense]|uniref:Single-stranded DNA-binding protein n=1 Tax=Sphaerisporangium siamense TaxID=795645 RepID=A0A7W7DAN5_9ACTN|nr:single-stranded DNA-binding protein [Sphaerisporangium siamense]MBB4703352.1 single-stranded DNA-binding protein [Sphaerisporangium siamense]GII87656.1 hypothetical protein Ssi03_56460 [Sphaerisporangium siamense]